MAEQFVGCTRESLKCLPARVPRDIEEELLVPAPYRTIPGILEWRRPEVLRSLTEEEVSR